MIVEIDFIDEINEVSATDMRTIEEIIDVAARFESIPDGSEVSITFVDNTRIQEINSEYRNKNVPTDVISFAMEELGEGEIEIKGIDMPRILGDIIISIPRAREQAEEYGHSFKRELGFLALHGFLHLLGYDHETNEEEKIMFAKQKEILDEYGLER